MGKVLQSFRGKQPISEGDSYFAASFLKSLVSEIKISGLAFDRVEDGVLQEAQDIFAKNLHLISDRQSQSHILMCAIVLAAFFQLEKRGINEAKAYAIVEEAFTKFGRFWTKLGTRLALLVSRDKMKMIAKSAEKRSASVYGESFNIVSEGDRTEFYSSNVKRCAYFDFFKVNGKPEMTKIMCKWDQNWADEIDSRKHGIQFSRPTTLANGGEMCRFQFTRVSK